MWLEDFRDDPTAFIVDPRHFPKYCNPVTDKHWAMVVGGTANDPKKTVELISMDPDNKHQVTECRKTLAEFPKAIENVLAFTTEDGTASNFLH